MKQVGLIRLSPEQKSSKVSKMLVLLDEIEALKAEKSKMAKELGDQIKGLEMDLASVRIELDDQVDIPNEGQ